MSSDRGRVKAENVAEAQKRVRARGYRGPKVWPIGQSEPCGGGGAPKAVGRRSGWKIVSEKKGYLVCRGRKSDIASLLIMLFGCVFIWVSLFGNALEATRELGFTGRSWFFGGVGVCVVVFGIYTLLAKPRLWVDAERAIVVRSVSVMGMPLRQRISTSGAAAVCLDRKEFVSADGLSRQYCIAIQTSEGEQWPIGSSSSRDAELELAEAIARCLSLPLLKQC